MKGIDKLSPSAKAAVVEQARLIAAEREGVVLLAALQRLSDWLENPEDGETYVTKITIKPNWGEEGDCFIIFNATIGGQKKAGFHGGQTFSDAIRGGSSRIFNGRMKWQEDVPYAERKAR